MASRADFGFASAWLVVATVRLREAFRAAICALVWSRSAVVRVEVEGGDGEREEMVEAERERA